MASHYPSSNDTRPQAQSNQCLRDRLVQINIQIVLLEEERRVVEEKLQSLTYPVLDLPFEVTSKIFVHCLPNAQNPEPIFNSSRQKLPTPLLLSQICQTWRSVAFRTKNLWARFHISLDEWSRDPTRASRRFVHWIERAGPSLSFILHRTDYSFTPTSSAILLPIVAQSGRWRDVTLSLPYKDLITETFQSSLHQRLPLLETLQITAIATGATPMVAFEHAPKLRALALERLTPASILLPWRQLTHFRGEYLRATECLHVLRFAVSLVECKLARVDQRIAMDDTTLLPPHLALKTLHLAGESKSVYTNILSFLTLPSLVELELQDCRISSSENHEPFVALLSRSRPPLLHLSLNSLYSHILHGFPFLVDLTALKISDLTVAEMTNFQHDLRVPASFLPNLVSFACSVREPHWFDSSKIDYGDLVDVLEFRCDKNHPGPRLKSFRMKWRLEPGNWHGRADTDRRPFLPSSDFLLHLPRLQNLVDEDMHISFIAELGETFEVWI